LYELGADEKVVQRILRHAKSHPTKERYIKAFDPAVLAAMRKLEISLDAMSQYARLNGRSWQRYSRDLQEQERGKRNQ
jgi:hypothetical protein